MWLVVGIVAVIGSRQHVLSIQSWGSQLLNDGTKNGFDHVPEVKLIDGSRLYLSNVEFYLYDDVVVYRNTNVFCRNI